MEDSRVLHLQEQYQKFSDLYLCYCGTARCASLHSYGPAVRPNYLIHYVLEGRGRYRAEDREYLVGKGEGFLIEPNKQTFYQADRDEPWTYLWVGFGGTGCERCLRAVGLGGGRLTFRFADGAALERLVEAMLDCPRTSQAGDFLLQSLLCQFFACLAQGIGESPETTLTRAQRENLYVHKALEYIRMNYDHGITVADVAEHVALDRSYLFTLFRKVLDTSPRDYLARFRLTRAKEQLTLTDAPVSSIALGCGYREAQVFSRAFKQAFGVTPVQYRQMDRERARRSLERRPPGAEDPPE